MIPRPSQPHWSSSNIDTSIRGPQQNRSFHACQSYQCPCQQLQVVSSIGEGVSGTRNVNAQSRSRNIQIVETRPKALVKKANNDTCYSSDGPSYDADSRYIYYNRATWRMYMRIREDRIMKKKRQEELVERISTPAIEPEIEPETEPHDEGSNQSQSSMDCFTSTNDNDENERDDRFLKLYNFILIPNGNANGNIASANQYNALSETSSLTSSEERVRI